MSDKQLSKRIWAEPYEGQINNGRWTAKPRFPELPTQYIRADLIPVERIRKIHGDIIATSGVDGSYSIEWVESHVGNLVHELLQAINTPEKDDE